LTDYSPGLALAFPFQITTLSVQSLSITVTKVEHNVAIDEALFSKPADGK